MSRESSYPEDDPSSGAGAAASEQMPQTLRSDWRNTRNADRAASARRVPASRQQLASWLQRGGWLIVSGLFAVVVILLLGYIVFQPVRPLAGLGTEPVVKSNVPQPTLPVQPTVTPVVSTGVPKPVANGAQFRVDGTSSDGLFLRPNPSTDGAPLKTLPEGTIVTIIGEDAVTSDYVWKNVRDPEGSEGWVAANYLQPAP